MRMVWEVLAVWLTAIIVPTVLVLFFLKSIRTLGMSAFEIVQKQLKECHDREITLQCRVEALEAERRNAQGVAPEHRQIDVSLSVTPGSEISLTPSPPDKKSDPAL